MENGLPEIEIAITLAEVEILAALHVHRPNPLWVKEIARVLHRTHGGLVRPVIKLIDQGLISEEPRLDIKVQGRRLKPLSITDAGRGALYSYAGRAFELDGHEDLADILRRLVVAEAIRGPQGFLLIRDALDLKLSLLRNRTHPVLTGRAAEHALTIMETYLPQAQYSQLALEADYLSRIWADSHPDESFTGASTATSSYATDT